MWWCMSSKFFECPFMLKLKTLVKRQNYDKSCMVACRTITDALDAPVQRGDGKLVWNLLIDEGVLRPVEGGWSSAAWLKENGFFYGEVPETSSNDEENNENMAKLTQMLETL